MQNCAKSGHAHIVPPFQDAYGNQFGQMVQDKSQDYQLIVGYEYQDTTVIRFKRKVNTCDGEDLALTVSLRKPDSVQLQNIKKWPTFFSIFDSNVLNSKTSKFR